VRGSSAEVITAFSSLQLHAYVTCTWSASVSGSASLLRPTPFPAPAVGGTLNFVCGLKYHDPQVSPRLTAFPTDFVRHIPPSTHGTMSVSEVTLTASLEWSIIQNIAEGTVRRWSRRRPRPLSHSQDRVARVQAPHTLAVNNNLAFLETGLRQLLLVRLATKTLPRPIFDELQNNLKRLCRNLDQYVNPSLVAAAMKGNQGLADAYPQLRALCDALISRATSNMQETPDMDLVASPGHLNQAALFILPPDSAAKEVLELTVACNSNLGSLYQEQGSGYFRPTSPQKYPTATAFGQRAVTVLEALLEHFTACKSPHEVLLALSDNLDAANPNTTHPILDMVLSDCSQDCHRHEAQCLPYQR